MFENLQNKISGIFDKLKGKGVIDKTSLNEALREIRVALLESDVSLSVAKDFIEKIREKALGQEVVRSVSPAQMVVKIVNDELIHLLGSENNEINLSYDKNELKIDQIIKLIEENGARIIDLSTDDGDLEDVFLSLTKN